jgi:hypothetical protein
VKTIEVFRNTVQSDYICCSLHQLNGLFKVVFRECGMEVSSL